jgi:hypothetical protein
MLKFPGNKITIIKAHDEELDFVYSSYTIFAQALGVLAGGRSNGWGNGKAILDKAYSLSALFPNSVKNDFIVGYEQVLEQKNIALPKACALLDPMCKE